MRRQAPGWIVFALGLVAVLVGTLWPFVFDLSASAVRARWRSAEWELFYRTERGLTVDADLLINLALFAPMGVGYGMLRAGRVMWTFPRALLLGLVLSITVEIAQLLTPDRVTQLADVWRNAVGCAISATVIHGARRAARGPG